MATYTQWYKTSEDPPKRITWVCGAEHVLVEEVVDSVRSKLAPSEMDYCAFSALSNSERDIWAAVNQYPMEPTATRLVLVRDAEHLKRWATLRLWLDNRRFMPTVYLLFVSGEPDLPYVWKDGKPTSDLKPHGEWFRDIGRLVRCSYPASEVPRARDGKPSRPGAPDVVEWVMRQASCSSTLAQYLLQRSGGNLATVRNVARKAVVIKGDLSEPVIDVLCGESPSDDFVDSLVRGQRAKAMLALQALPEKDYPRVVGALEARLAQLRRMNVALRQRKTLQDARMMEGVPAAVANAYYLKVAKMYDKSRVRGATVALAVADDALRSGARVGVMESLVQLW
jgi:hypothetical protein